MSRVLTTYKNPSIADRIASASDVHQLAALRRLILLDLARGAISPDGKTLDRWTSALWGRVLHFMQSATTGEKLTLVWNVTLNWTRPNEATAQFIESEYQTAVRRMPSPTAQRFSS